MLKHCDLSMEEKKVGGPVVTSSLLTLKPNTISTYMRMLRSIYNRGVEAGSAPYVPRLFHDVYTGVDVRQKKALPATELYKLLYEDPKSERLRRTQAIAALMFQFCGMSFADLA